MSNAHIDLKMKGEYKFRVRNAEGEVVRETEWMPNLITNIGLDRIGQGGAILSSTTACSVGEGSNPPVFADTALQTYHQTSNNVSYSNTNGTSPDYIGKAGFVYSFAVQTVNKNYTEVGVGWGTLGTNLWSRALIVDSGGAPTSFTVLVGEQLEVTYRLWFVPNLTDNTYTVTIAGVTYNCTTRPASLPLGLVTGIFARGFDWTSGSTDCVLYTGAIGAYTLIPSGTSTSSYSSMVPAAYTAGNYYRDYTISWGTTAGNLSGGFRSVWHSIRADNGGGQPWPFPHAFQTDFGASVPKDNTKTMSLTFRFSWGRL